VPGHFFTCRAIVAIPSLSIVMIFVHGALIDQTRLRAPDQL
jgi:hypothetical protein